MAASWWNNSVPLLATRLVDDPISVVDMYSNSFMLGLYSKFVMLVEMLKLQRRHRLKVLVLIKVVSFFVSNT